MRITNENPLTFNCKKNLNFAPEQNCRALNLPIKNSLEKAKKIILKAADKFAYTRPHMSVEQRNSRIGKFIIDNLKFIIGILPPKGTILPAMPFLS